MYRTWEMPKYSINEMCNYGIILIFSVLLCSRQRSEGAMEVRVVEKNIQHSKSQS